MSVTLDKQSVRAEISIGDLGTIETPNVVSFSVRRARNQMCASFQASIKVNADGLKSSIDILDEGIIIKAGTKGHLRTIFTGKVSSCVINPVRTDASKVMLNLAGKDILSRLEGQKINRRITTYKDGTNPPERIGYITNILRKNTPMRQKFETKYYTKDPKAVHTLPDERIVKTVDAYTPELDRNVPGKISGSIKYTIVERGGTPVGG
jgi:hypothetical protein